ncbi:MAG: hypothetical protein ABI868_08020 [Acidobacteriota bacterium]
MTRSRTLALALALSSPLQPVVGLPTTLGAAEQHEAHDLDGRSPFVQAVRQATDIFRDVNNTTYAGYGPALGCVSGPEEGAMGVHYVNPELLMDAEVKAEHPEALIYEVKGGTARLVGVEFIVIAAAWHQTHAASDPPILEGQLLHFVDSPNRFGLPAHYELHVWAWRDNPKGVFVDWNPRVSCGA